MNENKLSAIATTGRKWNRPNEKLAWEMAERLKIPYAERGDRCAGLYVRVLGEDAIVASAVVDESGSVKHQIAVCWGV